MTAMTLPGGFHCDDRAAVRRQPATSGADTERPLRLARLAVDAQGLALAVMASIAAIFALDWAQGFLIPLENAGACLGRGGGFAASHPLSGPRPRRHRHRYGGLDPIPNPSPWRCWWRARGWRSLSPSVLCHHLDDGANRPHEFRCRVHLAALLGLGLGYLGHAAQCISSSS